MPRIPSRLHNCMLFLVTPLIAITTSLHAGEAPAPKLSSTETQVSPLVDEIPEHFQKLISWLDTHGTLKAGAPDSVADEESYGRRNELERIDYDKRFYELRFTNTHMVDLLEDVEDRIEDPRKYVLGDEELFMPNSRQGQLFRDLKNFVDKNAFVVKGNSDEVLKKYSELSSLQQKLRASFQAASLAFKHLSPVQREMFKVFLTQAQKTIVHAQVLTADNVEIDEERGWTKDAIFFFDSTQREAKRLGYTDGRTLKKWPRAVDSRFPLY